MQRAARDTDAVARKTAIATMWLVTWRVFTRSLGLLSTLLLARILVPADFGLVAMATTFALAVEALSQLGVQDALVRRPQQDPGLYDTGFTLQVGRAMVTGVAVCVGAPFVASWFNETRLVPMLLVLAAASTLSGFENIGIVEFRREMQFRTQFLLLAVPRLLQVAVTVPVALALRTYWALPIGIVVFRAARVAMTWLVHSYRPKFRLCGWRELAGFSFWVWATSVSNLVWERCDPVILGPALGPALLGIYLLGFEVAILPVTELISPAAEALFAGFSSAQRQGTDAIGLVLPVAVTILLAVMPLVIAISSASGYIVVVLLGPKWAGARPLIEIMAWQCMFSPIGYVCSAALVACGRVRRNFVANVSVSAVKFIVLVLAISLTRRLDRIAFAVTVGMSMESAVYIFALRGTGEMRLQEIAGGLVRIALGTAAAVAVLMQTGLAWRPAMVPFLPALLQAMLLGSITVAVFGTVDLALWLLSGRPAGPERRAFNAIGHMLRPAPVEKLAAVDAG